MTTQNDVMLDTLTLDLCSNYVRRETRFYHVDFPNQGLSRRDAEQAFISTLGTKVPAGLVTSALLKQVFDIAIERKHSDLNRSVAVWGGSMECCPGNPNKVIWKENGTVSLNTWKVPSYRTLRINDSSYGPFEAFFNWVFPREEERTRILDWELCMNLGDGN